MVPSSARKSLAHHDILEECIDELFAPEGFWGRAAASHPRADEAGSFRRSDEA